MEREHRSRAWHAWHTAALSRAAKLPPLDKLMGLKKPQPQSWQQQLDIVRVIHAMHGGRLPAD